MKIRSLVFLGVLACAGTASAQVKVSGINSERGRFVFRNDASFIGLGIGAPTAELGFSAPTLSRAHFDPQFAIAPSVDVFIINNLSIGASIGFTFNRTGGGGLGGIDLFTFFFMPRVGYNIPIVNHFSFWPQFGIGVGVANASAGGGSRTEAMIPLDLYLPFLFHPVENFFMGIGPALRFYSLNDQVAVPSMVNIDILRFTLAGSVPVF